MLHIQTCCNANSRASCKESELLACLKEKKNMSFSTCNTLYSIDNYWFYHQTLYLFGLPRFFIQRRSKKSFINLSHNSFNKQIDSTQEPYMEVVNPFILKNKERMVVFLDQLSSVQEPGNPPQNTNNVDIGKYYCM